jgi:integrase
MRLGEVRGLYWGDLEPRAGIIHIRHNWQDLEGIKGPKCESYRDVPLPAMVYETATMCQKKSSCLLVFGRKDGRPLCNGYFRLALIAHLAAIGISDQERRARNITFHSLRHTFVSLARMAGIGDFQAQALAGHKSSAMMERYSHRSGVVDAAEIAEAGKIIEGFFKIA